MNTNTQSFCFQYLTPSRVFLCSFSITILSLLTAFGMTTYLNLIPCHLCVIQRFFYAGIALISIIGFLHHRSTSHIKKIYVLINISLAFLGFLTALRQSWLQLYPTSEVPACLPEWATLLNLFTPLEALFTVLKSSSDCAQVDWSFLGLSIAQYSVLLFLLIIVINFSSIFYEKK